MHKEAGTGKHTFGHAVLIHQQWKPHSASWRMSSFGQMLTAVAAVQEFDLDGGNLTGTLQPWIAACFPGLDELDLSFNQVSPCLQGSCAAAVQEVSRMPHG